MNRLRHLLDRTPEEPEHEGDYWVLATADGYHMIGRDTAAAVELALDAAPAPRWLVFRDRVGSRHRVLTTSVTGVWESTAAQRSAEREFSRARRLEEKADRRPWEDD